MKDIFSPTPYPDVNIVLQEFAAGIQSILGDQFIGLYLYGSLASGDFDPQTSDIDLIALTRNEIPDDQFVNVHDLHARFDKSNSPWSRKIEAAYIPLNALNHPPLASALYPQIEKGTELVRTALEVGWAFQRHTLREHGVIVTGPSPRSLIDPVDPLEMHQAAMTIVRGWQEQSRNDPSWIAWAQQRSGHTFIVLTLCRIRYSLQTGNVASKPAAALWSKATIGQRWRLLIDRALTNLHDDQEISDTDLIETLAFLDDTALLL